MDAMTSADANAVYDVLIANAGAREDGRESFVRVETACDVTEYRFMGALGFGGKFWRNRGKWYVTAYKEQTTPEVAAMIEATNSALAKLGRGVS